MKVRKHMIIHGTVQGVGFRYRAYYAASQLGLTGWVRNLYDGTVEMEAQGDIEAVRELMPLIEGSHRFSFLHVDEIEEKSIPLVDNERRFQVIS